MEANVPFAIPGPINTLKSANGPLLAPGARESGAFLPEKGLSLTTRSGMDVLALSPLRKMVFEVRLVSVASKVIVVPAAPRWLACVRAISMESARAAEDQKRHCRQDDDQAQPQTVHVAYFLFLVDFIGPAANSHCGNSKSSFRQPVSMEDTV